MQKVNGQTVESQQSTISLSQLKMTSTKLVDDVANDINK